MDRQTSRDATRPECEYGSIQRGDYQVNDTADRLIKAREDAADAAIELARTLECTEGSHQYIKRNFDLEEAMIDWKSAETAWTAASLALLKNPPLDPESRGLIVWQVESTMRNDAAMFTTAALAQQYADFITATFYEGMPLRVTPVVIHGRPFHVPRTVS